MAVVEDRRRFVSLFCLNVQGKYCWVNGVLSILDTGGCENLIDHVFAVRLGLTFHVDRTSAAGQGATSVTGSTISFREYVLLTCNFNGVRKVIRFYVKRNLPHDLLFGSPSLEGELGAVIDMMDGTVNFRRLGVQMNLIPSDRRRQHYNTFATFDVARPVPSDLVSRMGSDFIPLTQMQPYSSNLEHFLGDTNPFSEFLEEDQVTANSLTRSAALFDIPIDVDSLLDFLNAFESISTEQLQPQSSELMMAMDKPIFGTSVDYSASLEDMLVQAESLNSEGRFMFDQNDEDAANYCDEKSGTVSDENIQEGQERLNKLLDSYSDRLIWKISRLLTLI